ncbi:MAG: C-GCAxxG-C-C family protein [Anaerovoracaceae bacterium]|nr:C-GCAxxG-C-C family protein [Bacillota bacterium]MDY2671276.1 C-GCAxxG-C-C family protein [Anaerovoracaceae bacterium]
MTVDERKALAAKYHRSGYNCAQSVACAFAGDLGFDHDTVYKMAEGFGLGMGNMECTCGAVSGAVMAAGMKNSDPSVPGSTKGSTYKLSREINEKFVEKNKSLICADLKGVTTGQVLRSCPGCIDDAVEILCGVLEMTE